MGSRSRWGRSLLSTAGVATFLETDESNHRAVISAKGKDVGGQGNANAQITATLTQQGSGTQVHVDTDLELSGRVAQFGRGVIGDVTNKLLTQFSKNLEAEINGGGLDLSAPAASHQRPSLDDVEPLDVMGSMGGVIARRAAPALGALAALTLGAVLFARRPKAGGWAVNIFLTLPDAKDALRVAQFSTGGAA